MENIKSYLKNLVKKTIGKVVLAAVIGVIILLVVVFGGHFLDGDVVQTDPSGGVIQTEQSADQDEDFESSDPEEDLSGEGSHSGGSAGSDVQYIYLDVSGAVNAPSVVCIPEGSRVYEAIEAAGGRTEDSDVRTLNLASVCEDGQKIYVPTKMEIAEAQEAGRPLPGQEDTSASAGTSSTVTGGTGTSGGSVSSAKGKVNINTAGSEELQTLTGVGPAIASKIIDYRNTNGSFHSIEEVVQVSGIGEKTYEKFKDEICV